MWEEAHREKDREIDEKIILVLNFFQIILKWNQEVIHQRENWENQCKWDIVIYEYNHYKVQ